MHVLKHNKKAPATPVVPILSQWKVPGIRKMRGKRYNERGEYIGPCGPQKPRPEPSVVAQVKEAYRVAALLPAPVETKIFTLDNYRPLPGRLLLKRPPQITMEKGVLLPENKWRSECWFYVVKVGERVTNCDVGDRVIFTKNHRPKAVRLGAPYHLGRDTAVAGIVVESPC